MIIRWFIAAFAVLVVVACTPTGPQPQATITQGAWVSDDPTDPRNCAQSYVLLLTVADGGKEIAQDRYCEYPYETSAKVFKDRRGHIYVAVTSDQYRGTGMHPTEVQLKRVNVDRGTLEEVVTLQLADLDGSPLPDRDSRWDSTYDLHESDSGSQQLTVTYAPGPRPTCCAPPEKQVAVRLGSVGASEAAQADIRPTPEALFTPASKAWCGEGRQTMVLTVTEGGRTLTQRDQWCVAGKSTVSAQAATDRRGRIYVLLRGHAPSLDTTTGNASDMLGIFELVPAYPGASFPYGIEWIGDVVLSPPTDPPAQWPTTYRTRDSAGGGLEVIVDYSQVKSVGCCTPPEQQISIQIGP